MLSLIIMAVAYCMLSLIIMAVAYSMLSHIIMNFFHTLQFAQACHIEHYTQHAGLPAAVGV
jgi:hypothetical protein